MMFFIVARDQRGLFETLRMEFVNEGDVVVLLDRRLGDRRRRERTFRSERRHRDRRIRAHVSSALRSLGWAIVHPERR